MESISIKELISSGYSILNGLHYVPSSSGVIRMYDEYALDDFNAYYRWKECSIRYLQLYYPLDFKRFEKYTEDFERNSYIPNYLSNMIGVLEACEAFPSEKQLEQNFYDSRDSEIKMVENLENSYLDFKRSGGSLINSSKAIEAFHRWHAASCVLFDKWIYSTDEDFIKFQNIDSSGNGFVLSSEYNNIFSPYCKLMSRLKDGRDLKKNKTISDRNKTTIPNNGVKKKINIFISYSHTDKQWLNLLKDHLNVLMKYSDNIVYWDDSKLKGGDKWKKEIAEAIERANVAILLVSTDFLTSDFISTDELPPLLRKAEEAGTRILPLIVSPCDYDISDLEEFQAINSPDKTLADMAGDEASIRRVFLSLTKEIKDIIQI